MRLKNLWKILKKCQGSTSIVKKVKRKSDDKVFVAKIIKLRDVEDYKQVNLGVQSHGFKDD